MIDLVNALTTGATVAGALRGLTALENLLGRRNGNGKNGFSQTDHDTLTIAAARQVSYNESLQRGLDLLHEDLNDVKEILRNGKH